MAEQIIGRVTIKGTNAQIAALSDFVGRANDLLGTRYDPFDLIVRERAKMPIAFEKKDGTVIRARGHWSDYRRRMLVADDMFDAGEDLLRDKTVGHEFVHVLQTDWMGKWHRRQILPLITPACDNWGDLTIGDKWEGYVAAPYEALACYGSAALFGWAKPAYSTLYSRRITQANYAKTKELLLATAP